MKTNKQTQSVADSDRNNSDNPKPTEPSTQEVLDFLVLGHGPISRKLKMAKEKLQSLEAENANLQKAVESVRSMFPEPKKEDATWTICPRYLSAFQEKLEEQDGGERFALPSWEEIENILLVWHKEALKQLDATKEAE